MFLIFIDFVTYKTDKSQKILIFSTMKDNETNYSTTKNNETNYFN